MSIDMHPSGSQALRKKKKKSGSHVVLASIALGKRKGNPLSYLERGLI